MTDKGRPESLRVPLGQLHCVPGDVPANLTRIEAIARGAAAEGAQLLVLPETATTGYFIADKLATLAEPEDGPTALRLAALARQCALHLAIGMPVVADGRFYDAQLLFGPQGTRLATYCKAHLFSAERHWYCAGDTPAVVDTATGRIGMTVCYDLMFPDYVRRLGELCADLVINSTNWIADRWQREIWAGRVPPCRASPRRGRWRTGCGLP